MAVPSYIARWSKWFREDREQIEDETRPDRPVTFENIEQVHCLIDDDSHITIDEIQVKTGLNQGTIERRIYDHMKLKKVTTRWRPNQLTDSQRAERIRICKENLAKFEQGTWRSSDVVQVTSHGSIINKSTESRPMLPE
ncbi:unnamed protein product [Didymodactylos carnosus]|uniref:Histone-lysine N-methyltransferase SETMAR n=1 Tax=Didymodactylos carnosus TaxID=1234261 RepID=A0A8S2RF41_9BILA|nr:unnamed protein product [Didymodactylos carnosus]CAF4160833.1 unnamed protein product [Didymodactylos carnosus]